MSSTNIFTPFSEQELMPQEEKLEIVKKGKQFSIGVPKETCLNERRTCLTPDAVQVLVSHGHEVIVETGAGEGSFFTDLQYSESGAKITYDPKEAFGQDLVLKINPPTTDEIEFLKPCTYLVSALQINLRDKEYFKKLSEKKVNAIAFEFIVDEYKQLSLVRLIGEIAGNISVLYAAELLALSNGLMLGGITGVRPTEVVILGAGILKNNVKTAKYLNSPETEIYHKSQVLYGLNQGKQAISKNNLCLLVEGYMDVIALHQSGIEHVVSSSGTALTVEQIKLIKRLTENVTILFDGDAAGIKASFRSIDMLLSESMNIRVLLFPDGDDPDSFSRKHPQDYVEKFIKNEAKDFIDFKAEILLKDAGSDPIRKAEAIRDIVKSVAFVQNALKQEVYLKEVSNKFGLSEQSLFNELNVQKQLQKQHVSPQQRQETQVQPKLEKVVEFSQNIDPLLILEEKLVELMLKYGDLVLDRQDEESNQYQITVIEEIIGHFQEDDYEIQSEINRKIVEEIKQGITENELRSGNFFMTLMDENISGKIADALLNPHENSDWGKHQIFFSTEEEVVPKIVQDVIFRHKREFVMKIINAMKNELSATENNDETYKKIINLNQLRKELDEKLFRVL